MSYGVKLILWVAGLTTTGVLARWIHPTVAQAAELVLPVAFLWLLMHAMRIETAIRLTLGVPLSAAWIVIFVRVTHMPLPW